MKMLAAILSMGAAIIVGYIESWSPLITGLYCAGLYYFLRLIDPV